MPSDQGGRNLVVVKQFKFKFPLACSESLARLPEGEL